MSLETGCMDSGVAEEAGDRFGVTLEDLLAIIATGLGAGSR